MGEAMSQAGSLALALLTRALTSAETGLNQRLMELSAASGRELKAVAPNRFIQANVPLDFEEKSGTAAYPAAFVYCDRIKNSLTEKFRTFSGEVVLAIDLRVSGDDASEVARDVDNYVDSVLAILHGIKGSWVDGLQYHGGYQVDYGAMKKGGANILQSVRIMVPVQVSY